MLLTAGTAAVVSSQQDATHTADGTTLAGVAAGGLDDSGLRALLTRQVAREPARVTVVLGTRTVVIGRPELGLTIDAAATAEKALSRSGAGGRFGFGSARGKDVAPVLLAAPDVLRSVTARLVAAAEVAESHGELTYAAGTVTARPPAPGQSTTLASVERALREAAARLPLPTRVMVPVVEQPAHVTAAAVEVLAAKAKAIAATQLTLTSGARSTQLAGGRLATYLTITAQGDGSGHAVALGLSSAAAKGLATPVAAALSTPVSEPTVAAPAPTAVLTTQGNVTWQPKPATTTVTAGGRNGQTVTPEAALAVLLDSLRRDVAASTLPVPNQTATPATSDAAARSINALLGTFTTPFACCQPRVTNIALMARTVDGTLIAPGQTFSLNGIVGRRTKEKGYVEAPFILDGELSSDVGGGVSQFATTTLNAAFFAGLRLDKHQAHSFYISRYPAGREATVNFPSIDLAWTNTTSAPILVRAATTARSLTVALYGANDGRSVQAITGARRGAAGRDFRITVTRVLQLPGKPAQRESFTTTYNKPPEGH